MWPEGIQEMVNAVMRAPALNRAPQRRREATTANAASVGSPPDTSHGTRWAVEEPVMRSTLSDQSATSLASLAARCRATLSDLLRSRPTQLGPFSLCATTIPFSFTILTTLPAGNPCVLS